MEAVSDLLAVATHGILAQFGLVILAYIGLFYGRKSEKNDVSIIEES